MTAAGTVRDISLIVDTMIGSGICVSPTGLLDRTGSVARSRCVWSVWGLVSICAALAYAELGTMIHGSGNYSNRVVQQRMNTETGPGIYNNSVGPQLATVWLQVVPQRRNTEAGPGIYNNSVVPQLATV